MSVNRPGISNGLVHVYTGPGKGKTTAALGLALRASGHGLKVMVVQFVKGDSSCGEHLFVKKYHSFEIVQMASGDAFTMPREQLKADAQQTLAYAEEVVFKGKYDLVILDEILWAVGDDLISSIQVISLIDKKPKSVELVLTGRNATPDIVQRADYVTEMLMVKHPYTQGVSARRGIEC